MFQKPDFKRYIAAETAAAIIGGAAAVGSAGVHCMKLTVKSIMLSPFSI